MPADPFNDVELEAGARAVAALYRMPKPERFDRQIAAAVLAAALPDHDARVRADERARVAEEIAQAIEEATRHVDVTAAEMARTARAHTTTEEDHRGL